MGLPPKPRLASCLNPKGVRTPKRAADEAAPMLRQLRTKFIALNMALAALVLAASFATICYADYRADIDDVRNRLMAATSRSLHEPQLIPDAEPFHRGEAPREDGENAADADGTDDDDNRAGNEAAGGTDADNDAEGATSGNANPGKSVEGAETPAEDGSAPAPTQDIGAGTSDPGFAPPRIGGPGTAEEASLPVAVYYIADRTVMQLTDRSGATVPEALLVHAIPEVVSAEAPWGYLPDVGLYFAKHEAGPDLMVAFADGSAADGWRSLALVLTAVGLLPIAVAGVDIQALMQGAARMQEACTAGDMEQNPAWQYAGARYQLYRAGKKIEVLAAYEPAFRFMSEWWKQLYGESEGKESKGLFPASVEFTADLHSMGQYIQQGERHLFETVVRFDPEAGESAVPFDAADGDGLNFLAGKTMDFIRTQAMDGTQIGRASCRERV